MNQTIPQPMTLTTWGTISRNKQQTLFKGKLLHSRLGDEKQLKPQPRSGPKENTRTLTPFPGHKNTRTSKYFALPPRWIAVLEKNLRYTDYQGIIHTTTHATGVVLPCETQKNKPKTSCSLQLSTSSATIASKTVFSDNHAQFKTR